MAEFLTTKGVAFHLENIISNAKKKLVLVSPYLQISQSFYERLRDASKRGVSVKIIYGKDELEPKQKKQIAELDNVELFFHENLHAKCYFNENSMIITSMNMYAFSEATNREMGVLISRAKDNELFDQAVGETVSIMQSSYNIELRPEKARPKRGHCIRCSAEIRYNPENPYCKSCYLVWSSFYNFDYVENVCHRCGEDEATTMVKPQCYDCFVVWRGE